MIEQICAEINNYFVIARHRKAGGFTINNGSIDLPFLIEGQYFCIRGSRLNNGVHQYPATDLKDETFNGEIWEMGAEDFNSFLAAADSIAQWTEQNAAVLNSPYQSESFGGYSYSKGAGGGSGSGSGVNSAWDWRNQFAATLKRWRKINLDLGLVPVVYH